MKREKSMNLITKLGRFGLKGLPLMVALAAGSAVSTVSAQEAELPRTMVWNAYDLGSSGYAQASGIADALQKNYETRIRVIPTGTAIGRMMGLRGGKVQYGYLANEVFFATEGTFDFAAKEWGPQDLRVILGRPASNGFAVAKDSGVIEIADLKGKRIGYVTGSPAVNVKNDAYLAFAGLTREDVSVSWFGSYSALKDALIDNQIDAFSSVTGSSLMREIEASPRGLIWPEFEASNEEGWQRMQDMISFAYPYDEGKGAAISESDPVALVGYRYPMITAYADADEEEVYNLVKAIDDSFELYSASSPGAALWALDKSAVSPADAPFHPGAIRYAKEKGVWSDEDQAWHDARLARLEALTAAWGAAEEEFDTLRAQGDARVEGDPAETWPVFWEEKRLEAIAGLGK